MGRPSNPQDVSGTALKGKVSWQAGAKKNYKVTSHNKDISWENPMRAVASAWRTSSRVTARAGSTRHPKTKLLAPRRFVYPRGTKGGDQEKKSEIEDEEDQIGGGGGNKGERKVMFTIKRQKTTSV